MLSKGMAMVINLEKWIKQFFLFTAVVVLSSCSKGGEKTAPSDVLHPLSWERVMVPGTMQEELWKSIASSSDGTRLAAVEGWEAKTWYDNDGYIYTSKDGGETWQQRKTAGKKRWSAITSSSDGMNLAASVAGTIISGTTKEIVKEGYIYTSNDGGDTWVERTSSGSRCWSSIASSADGSKLAAVASSASIPFPDEQPVNGGYIYTSSDSGVTWTERAGAGRRDWRLITSSSDGSKLAACAGFEEYGQSYLYTSPDSGATWVERTGAGMRRWESIASSADGTKIVAVSGNVYISTNSGETWTKVEIYINEEGFDELKNVHSIAASSDGTRLAAGGFECIYTSTDGGETWMKRVGSGSRYWESIALSSDGARIAAASYGGYIYTSTDNGESWSERSGAGGRYWSSIAASPDGTKMAVTADKGYIYTSKDRGITWEERTGSGKRNWKSITISADGTKLAAVDDENTYTSSDSGETWFKNNSVEDKNFTTITSSADGTKLAAIGLNYQYIYTSSDSGETWTERAGGNGGSWNSLFITPDGSKLAVLKDDFIFFSNDGGGVWTKVTNSEKRYWNSVVLSSDGMRIAATEYGYPDEAHGTFIHGRMITSNNGGRSWKVRTGIGQKDWHSVKSSSDGTTLVAAANYDFIYISHDGGETWNAQTEVGKSPWMATATSSDCSLIAVLSWGHDTNDFFIAR